MVERPTNGARFQRSELTDFDSRDLPKFVEWSESFVPPVDEFNFVRRHVTATMAFLLLEIVLPKFIVVRGCVLRETKYEPSNFEHWWSESKGNTQAVESVINELHLWDLFDSAPGEYDEGEYLAMEAMAPRIADAWRSIAEVQFADRTFTVEVGDEYGPTVSLISHERDLGTAT